VGTRFRVEQEMGWFNYVKLLNNLNTYNNYNVILFCHSLCFGAENLLKYSSLKVVSGVKFLSIIYNNWGKKINDNKILMQYRLYFVIC